MATQFPETIGVPQLPEQITVPQLPERLSVPQLPETIEVPQLPEQITVSQLPERLSVPQLPERHSVPRIDPIAIQINKTINMLIFLLELRRDHLLATLREKREEMKGDLVGRQEMEEELLQTRRFVDTQIKHNKLHTLQNRIVAEMEAKLEELRHNAPPPQELRYLCDTQDFEECIARLGEITQHEIPPIPPNEIPPIPPRPVISDCAAFQQPIVAVGERGSGPGELYFPSGVSIETESGHIYVADRLNVIQIFSQTGDHLNEFGGQHLEEPLGILIHEDSIYVTDIGHHAIFLFKLPDLTMIKRVGEKGSGSQEFNTPRQLAISPNKHLYVPDAGNHRLQILTTNLNFKDSLQHQTMTAPVDVKFTNNEMFVLSNENNPCIHVFTLSGEKSRSLVTRGYGMQVEQAYYFCLDEQNNIVISDLSAHQIKVFSPEGDLLHTIGQEGHKAGMFYCPKGIAIHNTKLICVSTSDNFCLQIFSA